MGGWGRAPEPTVARRAPVPRQAKAAATVEPTPAATEPSRARRVVEGTTASSVSEPPVATVEASTLKPSGTLALTDAPHVEFEILEEVQERD